MNKELITSKRLLRLLAAVPVLLSGCVESEDYSSLKNDSEYVEMVFTQDNDGTLSQKETKSDFISMGSRQDRSY